MTRWLPFALAALVGCGHKEAPPSTTQAQLDSMTNALTSKMQSNSGGSQHQYGPPTGKIRIANLAELNGQPLGPVDLYDVRIDRDSTAVPIIKNLAFGQVSDYVSPRAGGNCSGCTSQLYLFQSGQRQGKGSFGTNIDNSGFVATDQMTIALGPSSMSNEQMIAYPAIIEAGKRKAAWVDSSRAVPAGQALLIALQANMSALDSIPLLYLTVDGTCPIATNDPRAKIPMSVGTEQHYRVTPGSHTLGLVTSPRGHGLLNCNGKTPVGTSTINVAAGKRYIVFVYGLTSDGLKTTSAPISE